MKDPVIIVENISKVYRLYTSGDLFFSLFSKKSKRKVHEVRALSGVSFTLNRGDVLGVIGGNGDGKSTLLKVLAQVIVPSAGKAILKGRVSSLLEVGTGFHPDLSGIDNVFINGTLLGMKKAEVQARLQDIIDFSEIGDFIRLPVKYYSSGMTMRLAFSVAVHLDADILLLDEIFAVGDANFQKKAVLKMEGMFKQGKTIVYVSHDLDTIKKLCTQCLLLNKGEVVASGALETVVGQYVEGMHQVFPIETVFPEQTHKSSFLEKIKFITSKEVALFRSDEEIAVDIFYFIAEGDEQCDVSVSLFLHTQKITMSFVSDLNKGAKNTAGVNRATMVIPANLLNQGVYYFSLSLHNGNLVFLDTKKEALFFQVISNHEKFDKYPVKATGIINLEK